jgi:uncharacterized phiE125 gp8 family phage protein
MSSSRIVQGLLQPYFYFIIPGTDDLTDAVVTCTMLDVNDVAIVDASSIGCYITDVAERQAEYRWQDGDTDLSGTFNLYFTITPDGVDPFNTEVFGVEIIASGGDELITVADVEKQIRFDLSNQSEHIVSLIQTVRENCESITRRALKPVQRTLNLNEFPGGRGLIEIPNPPLRSIDSISYLDTDEVEQTLDPTTYKIFFKNNFNPAQPSYIAPIYGTSWPVALYDLDSITITYTCGYGTVLNSEDVYETIELPKPIRQWMLINIANLYSNPETVIVGNVNRLTKVEIPSIANGLIADYKVAKL